MRILIVGAGALGGYFGARLLQVGRDVTFLVRPRRAAQLAKSGLVVKSSRGDAHIPSPPIVLAENIDRHYDLILVGCKAYDLEETMKSFAPAVGPDTAILPILNGMKHIDSLSERFGGNHVLGGLCFISATLDDDGIVMHLNEHHGIVYGELGGADSPRMAAINAAFAGANFDPRASQAIVQELWEKWVLIASMAGITCLMRAQVGDIEKAGAAGLALTLLDECSAISAAQNHPPGAATLERARGLLTARGSSLVASMLKDIERGARTEGDHILGDLLARRVGSADERSPLAIAYAHVNAYEARRARELRTLTPASE
jgi:2-dehydropantoate 2-reductase